MQPSTAKKRIVIIGGGPTGLAAAYEADRRNQGDTEVVVLEREERVGGWLQSSIDDGVCSEQGPRAFRASGAGGYTLTVACELGLQPELIAADKKAAKRFLFWNGRLHNASLWFVLSSIGLKALVLEFLNWGAERQSIPKDDESVAAFFIRRFGSHTVPLAQCFVNGIFAGDASVLSLRSCFPTIHDMEVSCGSIGWSIVKSFFGFYKPPPPVHLTDEVMAYQKRASLYNFKSGMTLLPAALYRTLQKSRNVKVRRNCLVVGLGWDSEQGRPKVKLVTGEELVADHVVSTISPYYLAPLASALAEATGDAAVSSVPDLIKRIPHADLTLVNILGNTESIVIPACVQGFGFLMPDSDILGCTMDSLVFPQVYEGVLYKGKPAVCITVMIGGMLKDKKWLRDIDPVATAVEGVKTAAGIVVNASATQFKVTNVKNGIPQFTLGYSARLNKITTALTRYGVSMAGMSVIGVGVNDSLLSGLRAVQCIEASGYFASSA